MLDMKKLLSIVFILSSLASKAQLQFFQYGDSVNQIGISPVNKNLIVKNKIKEIRSYSFDATTKDSALNMLYSFDSLGNLLSSSSFALRFGTQPLYTYRSFNSKDTKECISIIFDAKGDTTFKRVSHKVNDTTFQNTIYQYYTYYMQVEYYVEVYNKANQLIKKVKQSTAGFPIETLVYNYDKNGLPKKAETVDKNGKHELLAEYHHEWEKGSRRFVVYTFNKGVKFKMSESYINTQGQCLKTTFFQLGNVLKQNGDLIKNFVFNAGSTIDEYRWKFEKDSGQNFKYHYTYYQ